MVCRHQTGDILVMQDTTMSAQRALAPHRRSSSQEPQGVMVVETVPTSEGEALFP